MHYFSLLGRLCTREDAGNVGFGIAREDEMDDYETFSRGEGEDGCEIVSGGSEEGEREEGYWVGGVGVER